MTDAGLEQTPAQYRFRLDAAVKGSGKGDLEWGERFKAALAHLGLALTPIVPEKDEAKYPDGYPYTAPRPFPADSDEWHPETWVVWA